MYLSSINRIVRVCPQISPSKLYSITKHFSTLLVVIITTVSVSALNAQNESIRSRVSALLDDLQNKGQFSGAVSLYFQGSQKILEDAYGFSNIPDSIVNSTNTQFSLASLGKIFTIVATLKLVENGDLDLEDPLSKFNICFKDKRAQNITIKQLLAHTSGFGHYWENKEYLDNKPRLVQISEYMEFIKNISLDFDPGTKYQYSNTGYIILGKVIESVTGSNYYDHIQETIFKPLGMHRSNFKYKYELTSNYAKKYTRTKSGDPEEVQTDLSPRGASDGGGYSSIGDMAKLSDGIFYNGFLSNELISLMVSNYESDELTRKDWKFDLVGGAPGVSTVLGFHGPSEYSLVVLSNFDSPASESVALGVLQIISEEISEQTIGSDANPELYRIRGKVIDRSTKRPIPYTNIGIKNKGIGTASGEDGYFELEVPNTHKQEEITFSALGYSEESCPTIVLFEQKKLEIELNEKTEQLKEVIVTGDKPKLEKAGNSTLGLFTSGAYIGGGDPGASLITLIEMPSKTCKLQKVHVHIRDNDLKKEFKLRVRVLERGLNNYPGNDILDKSIIVSSRIQKGWLVFDLSKSNLIINNDIYLGIEWVEEKNERLSIKEAFPRISYSVSKKVESYARTTSLNNWKPIAISPNIYGEFIIK